MTSLRGNHDQMFIDAVLHHDVNSWFFNGGDEALNSYAREPSNLRYGPLSGIYDPLMGAHAKWLNTLPFYSRTSIVSIATREFAPACRLIGKSHMIFCGSGMNFWISNIGIQSLLCMDIAQLCQVPISVLTG